MEGLFEQTIQKDDAYKRVNAIVYEAAQRVADIIRDRARDEINKITAETIELRERVAELTSESNGDAQPAVFEYNLGNEVFIPKILRHKTIYCPKCNGRGRLTIESNGETYYADCPKCRNLDKYREQEYVEYEPQCGYVYRITATHTFGNTEPSCEYEVVGTRNALKLGIGATRVQRQMLYHTQKPCKAYCDVLNNAQLQRAERRLKGEE